MMKYTPEVRTDHQPMIAAAAAVTPRQTGRAYQMEIASESGVISASTYPESPKNAAWPKLIRPVNPMSRSRLMAKSPSTRILVTSWM